MFSVLQAEKWIQAYVNESRKTVHAVKKDEKYVWKHFESRFKQKNSFTIFILIEKVRMKNYWRLSIVIRFDNKQSD